MQLPKLIRFIVSNPCSFRYQCLTKRHGNLSNRDQVLSVIKELNIPPSEWQVGKTKVFLRSVVHEPLEDARKQMISSKAIIIQKIWRRYQQQQRYQKLRKATLLIQHAYSGWKLRIEFLRKRRACIVIQSHLRGVFAREVWKFNGSIFSEILFFLFIWVKLHSFVYK